MKVCCFLDDAMDFQKAPFSFNELPFEEIFYRLIECGRRCDQAEKRCSV